MLKTNNSIFIFLILNLLIVTLCAREPQEQHDCNCVKKLEELLHTIPPKEMAETLIQQQKLELFKIALLATQTNQSPQNSNKNETDEE